MALIKCSECGKEISDKASSCPNCGMPLRREDRGTYDVVITREKQWFLINPAATVTVDNEKNYELKSDSSVTIPMSTGDHTLLFSLGPRKTEAKINVTENMNISMKMNRLTGEIDVTGYKLESKTNTPNVSIEVGGIFKS
ncbi:MAG: zinc ribbon domain-containing protein [Lachnospiraceae bacterium]